MPDIAAKQSTIDSKANSLYLDSHEPRLFRTMSSPGAQSINLSEKLSESNFQGYDEISSRELNQHTIRSSPMALISVNISLEGDKSLEHKFLFQPHNFVQSHRKKPIFSKKESFGSWEVCAGSISGLIHKNFFILFRWRHMLKIIEKMKCESIDEDRNHFTLWRKCFIE